MSRLPLRTREILDDDGREVWDSITATRGSIVTDEGALMGPFNAWVTAPGIGGRLAELGAALRFQSSIERRLLELGFVEGATVEILHEGPVGGDPIAVRVNDCTIALRRREAMAIIVS